VFPLPSGTSLQGGAGGSAGPASSKLQGESAFDSSNWVVSTGGSKSVGNVDLMQLALIAGAVVLVLALVWKKR
jgi:NADPH:quinone reductase-like Zn-dependent oxidoreductase